MLALPENVSNALAYAFRDSPIQTIGLLPGGLSGAPVYKIMVDDKPYVLKSGGISGCMQLAADAGIAPPVYFSDKASGLLITGFMEHQPGISLEALARTIKGIHHLPAFPAGNSLLATVEGVITQFKGLALAQHLAYYHEIRKHYPWYDTDRVPSHNDLNPGNLIFDGHQIWVIDWDAAYQNDRYVDLSIAANFYVTNKEQENRFLVPYFGEAPTDHQRARFFLMRQVCRMVYGVLLFDKGTLGQNLLTAALTDMRSPRFADEMNKIADIQT